MNVVIVLKWLRSGGAEKQALLIARALAETDRKCQVYTLSDSVVPTRIKLLLDEARHAGAQVQTSLSRFALWKILLHSLRHENALLWTWGTRADLFGWAARWVAGRGRLVCSLRSAFEEKLSSECKWRRFLDRNVSLYVANNSKSCEILGSLIPGASQKCRILHNVIDSRDLAEAGVTLPTAIDTLRVVMIGNLRIHEKGYDFLVNCLKLANERKLPIHVTIAGRGDDKDAFWKMVDEAGVRSLIDHVGEVQNPYGVLRQGHLFLLTSRIEGCPNALIEAMNLGLPCIATQVGDLPALGREESALALFEHGDVEGVVGELENVLKDWPAARQTGARLRRFCRKRFSGEDLGSRVVSLLQD